ncbi:hypothetical protein AWB80_03559 [Caballeronia pedi]|uniref:Uncharacterized protein n=1 Tax=Caballeronia pedi TaxID=1777141 RepID=A0A158BH64_9BURK|nr:hypothetical protein [Caballeronia pedi]SAK69389.1 hypothetical protein AWB80_03559 [Caballeronia pedi]
MSHTHEQEQTDIVIQHATMMHELTRLREVLSLIHDIAQGPPRPNAPQEIARLARCALIVSAAPDYPDFCI